ncbi:phosphotransferase [Okeanomitos corallinicola TIOX110]|uniref:Phosphotransferase n=1 Tax=Okeanomitos corallinicola TIOX110 TaxID=3133117 RepID=A0ABZ2UPB1_9CYAN
MVFVLSSQNVFNYLISKGICNQEDESLSKIEPKPAKNFNLLINLPDGRQLLVKQERLTKEGKIRGEFLEEWQIHNFYQTFPEISHIRSSLSEVIHFDEENSIIVFNYLNDYRDLSEFHAKENIFPVEIAHSIGETLATIHHLTLNNSDYQKFFQTSETIKSQINYDLTRGLERITPEVFGSVTAEGLKFFSLYQKYDNLGKAIAELSQAINLCCLTHNDLKLNNILLSKGWESQINQTDANVNHNIIRLIDWEDAGWGDPASDLGAMIASYLQIWLYSMVTSKTIPIENSLRLAAIPLALLQPSLSALVTAYFANFPEILEQRPDFLNRVIQFAGFSLIRSIQAKLQHERSFGNPGICILQVSKSLLCRPQASVTTIFGMETEDLLPTKLSVSIA